MYIVYDNNKITEMTKGDFINHLISIGQVKKYENMNKRYKKECSENDCPNIYRTKAGYVYSVIK